MSKKVNNYDKSCLIARCIWKQENYLHQLSSSSFVDSVPWHASINFWNYKAFTHVFHDSIYRKSALSKATYDAQHKYINNSDINLYV
jgi:hypothetical protein